jgi:hypothetical protein
MIIDWKEAAQKYINSIIVENDSVQFGDGVDGEIIAHFERELGFEIPSELKQLYGTLNGFGYSTKNGTMHWRLYPIERIQELLSCHNERLRKSSVTLDWDYVPIFDWGNGDTSGYLKYKEQQRFYDSGIWMFDHEAFFSENGEEDYLYQVADSLIEFLS